jgi:effector-binding domain-containing protein
MAYEARRVDVVAQPMAAVRRSTTRSQLGRTIIGGFDVLWPFLRANGARTGRNVVIYRRGLTDIEIGVEIFSDLTPSGEVFIAATPAGEAVTAVHFGDYAEMHGAYQAIERWCAHAERTTGPSWEVYGHWEDDPAKRRTDIFFSLLGPRQI